METNPSKGRALVTRAFLVLGRTALLAAAVMMAGCFSGRNVLKVQVENERVMPSGISAASSDVTVRVEAGQIRVPAHLISMNSSNVSDIRVTAYWEGQTIVLLEDVGNSNSVTSFLPSFKTTETIDTTPLSPGQYTLIIMRHSWEVGSKSEGTASDWTDTTILQEQVTIAR